MLSPALTNVVITLVSLVWVANFLGPFLVRGYQADPQLNLVFMSIVGGALALQRRPSNDGRDGDTP